MDNDGTNFMGKKVKNVLSLSNTFKHVQTREKINQLKKTNLFSTKHTLYDYRTNIEMGLKRINQMLFKQIIVLLVKC